MDRININLYLEISNAEYLRKIKHSLKDKKTSYSDIINLIILDYIKSNKIFNAEKVEKNYNKFSLTLQFPKDSNYRAMQIRPIVAYRKSICFLCENIIPQGEKCFYNVLNNLVVCADCKKMFIEKS
jgi:hypothetical protein